MGINDLNLIFENDETAFYMRHSNKNKYYYKGTKSGSRITRLKRIKSAEFWEEFQINKAQNIEKTPEPEKPEPINFEVEEPEPRPEETEEEQEETNFLDRSIF